MAPSSVEDNTCVDMMPFNSDWRVPTRQHSSMAEQPVTILKNVRAGLRKRSHCVRFQQQVVSDIITRPYTPKDEVETFFYQPKDFVQFRSEAQLEREQCKNVTVLALEADCPFDSEFYAFTSVFSIILVAALFFAYVLSRVERYARSLNNHGGASVEGMRTEDRCYAGLSPTLVERNSSANGFGSLLPWCN
jgi:hypothetical protein